MHDVLLKPEAKLTHWNVATVPSKYVAEAMGERDTHTDGARMARLEIRYDVKAPESGKFVPRVGGLHGGRLMYESIFDSCLVVAHEADTGKVVGTSDAKGDPIPLVKDTKYVFRVQAVFPEASGLEHLKSQPLNLRYKLSAPISLTAHSNKGDALAGKTPYAARKLQRYVQDDVFLAPPAAAKVPKKAKAGDFLSGHVLFCDYGSSAGALNKGRHPQSEALVTYHLGPSGTPTEAAAELPPVPKAPGGAGAPTSGAGSAAAAAGGGSESSSSAQQPTEADEKSVADAVRDASVSALAKLSSRPAFEMLYDALLKEHPEHVPLLKARLAFLAKEMRQLGNTDPGLGAASVAVAQQAHAIVEACKPDELAAYFGRTVYEEELEGEALAAHTTNKEKKSDVVEALLAKASAFVRCVPALTDAGGLQASEQADKAAAVLGASLQGESLTGEPTTAEDGAISEAFKDAMAELGLWRDLAAPDKKGELALLLAERHLREGRPAKALMLVHECVSSGKAASFDHFGGSQGARSARAGIVAGLGWDVFSESIERGEAGLRAHKAQSAAPL